MTQTSVDFLWRWWMDNPFASYEEGVEAYRKAKVIHEKEIIAAIDDNYTYNNNDYLTIGEQYYKKIYGK
jgi:hypothetical protein